MESLQSKQVKELELLEKRLAEKPDDFEGQVDLKKLKADIENKKKALLQEKPVTK